MKNILSKISLLLRDYIQEPAADAHWIGIEKFFEQNREESLRLIDYTINKTLYCYRIASVDGDMKYVIVLKNNRSIVNFLYEPMSILTEELIKTIQDNMKAACHVDMSLYNELDEILAKKKIGDRVPSWVAG